MPRMETDLTEFDWLSALGGGVLIGLSATLLLGGSGRIAGISGILGEILARPVRAGAWRWLFVAGLVLGALGHQWLSGQPVQPRTGYPILLLVFAGLLVGLGTRLGSGCTSGHGVCGIARLSMRSVVATITFVAVAMVTVAVVRHAAALGGGA